MVEGVACCGWPGWGTRHGYLGYPCILRAFEVIAAGLPPAPHVAPSNPRCFVWPCNATGDGGDHCQEQGVQGGAAAAAGGGPGRDGGPGRPVQVRLVAVLSVAVACKGCCRLDEAAPPARPVQVRRLWQLFGAAEACVGSMFHQRKCCPPLRTGVISCCPPLHAGVISCCPPLHAGVISCCPPLLHGASQRPHCRASVLCRALLGDRALLGLMRKKGEKR